MTTPKHYDKGQHDLIQKWYDTKPFNEFCSAMESHIDKYVFRHRFKGTPIEDLLKAQDYIERLIGYHKIEASKK